MSTIPSDEYSWILHQIPHRLISERGLGPTGKLKLAFELRYGWCTVMLWLLHIGPWWMMAGDAAADGHDGDDGVGIIIMDGIIIIMKMEWFNAKVDRDAELLEWWEWKWPY